LLHEETAFWARYAPVRTLAFLAAVMILAGAFFASRKLDADAAALNRQRAEDRAGKAASEAVGLLEKQLALFQLKAQGAAASQELQAIVRSAAIDANTLKDAFNTEPWWELYRERGCSSALFVGTNKVGATATLLNDAELSSVALGAETSGESTAFVSHQGLFLVAGARLPFAVPGGAKVAVVLARPLNQEELDALPAAPLLISDGTTKLGMHGDASRLEPFIGREDKGVLMLDGAVASARKLGAAWVWSLAPVDGEVQPAVPPFAVWGGAGLVSLLVVAGGFAVGRRGKPAPRRQGTLPMPIPLDGRNTLSVPEPSLDRTTPSHSPRSRYIEVAPLGEGGMAKVSLAVTHGEQGFRRQFVVKRLKAELTVNPEVVAQFIDEARLGASLVHSNIVPVFDFGRDADGFFIAQEYIMGRDLDAVRRALWDRNARLDVAMVLYVAQEVLKALSYAHGKTDDAGKPLGLVHRDVSPNNLMISARGEVKLLDFGIVKAENKLSQTQEGMIKGNVFYMSPEQARGLPVDPRADLFSLGLVLYTAFTGETLYRGVTNYDLLTRAGEGLGKREWDQVNGLPAELAELLFKALQPDPKRRFQSAEEFSRAIPSGGVAPAAAMQKLMEDLFKEAFASERSRFVSAPGAHA
jgi:hypothetical protein